MHTAQKSTYPHSSHHATHLSGGGGQARFPGHKHLLNTMSDLHWCLAGVYDLENLACLYLNTPLNIPDVVDAWNSLTKYVLLFPVLVHVGVVWRKSVTRTNTAAVSVSLT